MADATGNIGTGQISDLIIDLDASITVGSVEHARRPGNLDAASHGQGTIVRTGACWPAPGAPTCWPI